MQNKKPIPQPLTEQEQKEFAFLKKNLFEGAMFIVFDDATLESAEYKRYDLLLRKKMEYLAHVTFLMANN